MVAGLHSLYAWWFQPPLPLQGAALLADVAALAAGIALALTSRRFRAFLNRMPLEERGLRVMTVR